MAVDLCVETFSPRISFSHDLDRSPHSEYTHPLPRLDSTFPADFNFCPRPDIHPISSADELFSDGKILPLRFRTAAAPPPPSVSHHLPPPKTKKESLREILANPYSDDKPFSSSSSSSRSNFWGFKRSSSLNCGSSNHRGSSLWSTLPLLSRSKSTGSDPSPRKPSNMGLALGLGLSSGRVDPGRSGNGKPKPPMRRSGSVGSGRRASFGSSGGVRVSPVLNMAPCMNTGSAAGLFGFRFLFCNAKNCKGKKKSSTTHSATRSKSTWV